MLMQMIGKIKTRCSERTEDDCCWRMGEWIVMMMRRSGWRGAEGEFIASRIYKSKSIYPIICNVTSDKNYIPTKNFLEGNWAIQIKKSRSSMPNLIKVKLNEFKFPEKAVNWDIVKLGLVMLFHLKPALIKVVAADSDNNQSWESLEWKTKWRRSWTKGKHMWPEIAWEGDERGERVNMLLKSDHTLLHTKWYYRFNYSVYGPIFPCRSIT